MLTITIMTMNKLRVIGAVALLSASIVAQATVIRYETVLSGAAEDPPVVSPGTGSALVTYDMLAHTLRVQIEFADLVAGTTVAHIHAPTATPGGGNVGVAVYPGTFPGFPAGVTSGSYDHTIDLTVAGSYTGGFFNTSGGGTAAGAEVALAAALAEGRAYVNIHTSFAPGGEIRGFLSPVPDATSTGMLLFAALLGLSALARRQQRVWNV